MIAMEAAIAVARDLVKRSRFRIFEYCSADFHKGQPAREELPFLKPSSDAWVVRFKKREKVPGTSVDDGDELICVEVDATAGTATLLEGL